MTYPDDPDQLRRDIEHTQRNLSTDVDMLAEKVTPGRIVQRRMNRARRAMTTMRERVMGSGSDTRSTMGYKVGTMGDKAGGVASSAKEGASSAATSVKEGVSSAASTVTDTVGEAPQAIRRGTEGNPLAAGLIAFGAGWLLSSLVPASKAEQQLAEQAKEQAREIGQPVAQQLGQVAEQVKENMREPAQQAVESVKSTAADAAETVKGEAKQAKGDVTDRAQQAKSNVQEQRQQ